MQAQHPLEPTVVINWLPHHRLLVDITRERLETARGQARRQYHVHG